MKKFFRYLLLSLAAHALLFLFIGSTKEYWMPQNSSSRPKKMKVTYKPRQNDEKDLKKENDKDKGQIVELPKPLIEEKPKEADYLAEQAHKVEKETRSEKFTMNPEVIAEEYSEKKQLQFEEAIDVNATEASSGAKTGNHRFKPNRDGALFSLPSQYSLTNKDGLDKPTLASSTTENLSGAPSNDRLLEERSNRTQLNAHAYKYASYMNQIRRLVNFFWQQNLDNLSGPLHKNRYETVVSVEISDKGELISIEVLTESGNTKVDQCVTKAFKAAGPFPKPPELLVKNGTVLLPDFGFELQVSAGENPYKGVDPRAGVRFPGILKTSGSPF